MWSPNQSVLNGETRKSIFLKKQNKYLPMAWVLLNLLSDDRIVSNWTLAILALVLFCLVENLYEKKGLRDPSVKIINFI